MENEHPGHGVGAVHQGSRTLEDLHGMDAGPIDFDAVLVAPLLPFLADSVIHDHHPVVTQAADDRL